MPPNASESPHGTFDTGWRGLQHHGLRRANERAVLTVIGFNPGVSNAEISRLTGLAPQTVSAILSEIDTAGLLMRGEVLRGRRGQPATPIYLRPEGAYSIGVEIGWRHVDVLLIDMHAQVLEKIHRVYDFPDATRIVDDVLAMVKTIRARLSAENLERLQDLGLAMPTNLAGNISLVEAPPEQGRLWAELDIAKALQSKTGLEVSVFNDGNAACWGELIAFSHPRPASFVHFLIGRYIAAGILSDGVLWEGPTGNSANLGSMLVVGEGGPLQPAHSVASLSALSTRLHAAGFTLDDERPEQWPWSEFGQVLDDWLKDSAVALARVIFNTGMVIENNLVLVGGVFDADVLARLVDRLRLELAQLPVQTYVPPQVMAGHIGALAPALGAAELVLYRRFFSRSLVDLGA